MGAEAKLKALGLELPPAPKPVGSYVGAVRTANLLYMSGCGPRRMDGSLIIGKLGKTMSVDEGYQAARAVGLNMLSNIRAQLGSLDKVKQVLKVLGMVNADPEFGEMPTVINGFSDLFIEVFGDAGRGARSAVGMATLPFKIAVEVEMVLEVLD